MKLILLGTAGYHPSDTRQTACLMIPEQGIVLDAGTGFFRVGRFLKTDELDVYLTHAHLDHVVGLTYLLNVVRQHPLRRVTVHAAAEKLPALSEHLFAADLFPVKPICDFRPLTSDAPLSGPGRLRAFPLDHPGGSLGFRLDWPGHSLAYVTDTVASDNAGYRKDIDGVALLLHECSYPEALSEMAALTGHSTPRAVATLARDAKVGRLVMLHIDPLADEKDPVDLKQAQSIFPRTTLGTDFLELEF